MINKSGKKREEDHSRVFVSGVLLLSCSTILIKILGLAYKIPMMSLLGAEGMGYFNSAYEIYTLLCLAATTGLPVAVSMMVSAENSKGDVGAIKRILNIAMSIACAVGFLGVFLLLFFGKAITGFVGNANAFKCVVAIAPSLLCVCVSSIYRGYFQGFNRMLPTAVSQIIETLGKLVLGVAFAYFGIKKQYDMPTVAALAALGLTFGMMVSSAYLFFQKKPVSSLTSEDNNGNARMLFKFLCLIAVPITISSLVTGLSKIIDMTLILRRLQDSGTAVIDANKMYGAYTTLAVPLFSLIPSLVAPISLALVPSISSAIERKSKSEQIDIASNAIRLTALLAVPASMGLVVFSFPVLRALFSGEEQSVSFSAPLLSVLGAAVLFSCVITTTNAILHAYKKTIFPLASMLLGACAKFVSAYFLIGDTRIGIFGAPISTLICDAFVATINLMGVFRLVPDIKHTVLSLWRVLVASLLSISVSVYAYTVTAKRFDNVYISLGCAIVVAFVLYLIGSFALKSLTSEDIMLLPCGEKIVSALKNRSAKDDGGKNDG